MVMGMTIIPLLMMLACYPSHGTFHIINYKLIINTKPLLGQGEEEEEEESFHHCLHQFSHVSLVRNIIIIIFTSHNIRPVSSVQKKKLS